MDTATVFVYPKRELAGLPCFDVRFDTQELPGGVYVVGFLAIREKDELKEVVAPIHVTESQKENLQTALEYARVILKGYNSWASLEEALNEQLSRLD